MDSRVYNYGHARPVAVGSARSLGVIAEVGAGAGAGYGDGDGDGDGKGTQSKPVLGQLPCVYLDFNYGHNYLMNT